jgi:hypothetical protein
VIVMATTKDHVSMMTTASAMEPTKSPAGPGSRIIGMKLSAVVAVEAKSGMVSRPTLSATARDRGAPPRRRRAISSVITMPASTSRPSATIMPVTLIWWIGRPMAFIVARLARLTTGRITATISAARRPSVTNSTATTRPTPSAMLPPTSASRSAV